METSLIPIYGISMAQKKALVNECGITSVSELVAAGKTPDLREELARKLNVNRKEVDFWVKQADLLCLEGMTSEYAYFLVHAGIRSVQDLARININVTRNALQAAVNAHSHLEYEKEEEIVTELPEPIKCSAEINQFSSSEICITAQENQEYLFSDGCTIPTNWKKSQTSFEDFIVNIPEKTEKPVIFTRLKDKSDKLVVPVVIDIQRSYKSKRICQPSERAIRMRTGEVKQFFVNKAYAFLGDTITFSDCGNSLEFYKDKECTVPLSNPVKRPLNSNYLIEPFYIKAVKANPCSQVIIYADDNEETTFSYQVVEREYKSVTCKEQAPEITEAMLEILKGEALKFDPSALVMNNLGLIYPDMPQEIINILKEKVGEEKIDVSDETEPLYLLEYDKIQELIEQRSESDIINEGLNSLRDINIELPLPKYFNCKVTYRSRDELKGRQSINVSGLLVEVSGIINPNSDSSDVLTAYTDSQGRFIISLPDKYSMKECITFTFSEGSNKQIFNVNASDIIRDSLFTDLKNNTLSTENFLEYIEKIDTLNNEISLQNNQLDIANLIINIKKSMTNILNEINQIQNQLENRNLSDFERNSLNTNLEYFQNDYSRKEIFVLQLQTKLDTNEVDINKIKTSIEKKLSSLKSSRKNCIVKIFGSDTTKNEAERTISSILAHINISWNYGIEKNDDGFVIIEEIFKNYKDDYARALPSVKLMGEDEGAIWLPTDRAPSRTVNYSLLQRLVEPAVYPPASIFNSDEKTNNTSDELEQRIKLNHPIDISEYKLKLSTNTKEFPKMSSLGMGYTLNMHQSWVPDGFALGELLYSLILAPGEEQKILITEKKQSYDISQTDTGQDYSTQSQSQSQSDNIQAMYDYVMAQEATGSSSSEYDSYSWGIGGSVAGGYGSYIVGGLTGGYSKTHGTASSTSKQTNNHHEASQASQAFNQKFAAAATVLQEAKRVSIQSASSNVTSSTASKIIANHNHSHSMTVQYWEVSRRYRLETSIDGIDLVLFVPFDPICFLPDGNSKDLDYTDLFKPTLTNEIQTSVNDPYKDIKLKKIGFNERYAKVMQNYSVLRRALPYEYRSGLDLMQKFYTLPFFCIDDVPFNTKAEVFKIKILGNFCEFDRLSVEIHLNNSDIVVKGRVDSIEYLPLNYLTNTCYPHSTSQLKEAITSARNQKGEKPAAWVKFELPYGCTKDNISSIVIKNNIIDGWTYAFHKDENGLLDYEKDAMKSWVHWQENRYSDNVTFDYDDYNISKFEQGLPEFVLHPVTTLSAKELRECGPLSISVSEPDFVTDTKYIFHYLIEDTVLDEHGITYTYRSSCPRLSIRDLQKIEETFQHIVSENIRYSKAIWQSLTTDELAMMLEQFTVDMDFDNYFDVDENTVTQIPLLNCINVKKPLGFYGNCILFPFTYPEKLAKKLGKTAAEIQDALYRYHASNFRSPSTVISVPTEGMIGEAVLGETNVSEKIDITRFWNWKDSETSNQVLDKDYIDKTDYLSEKELRDLKALDLAKLDNIKAAENNISLLSSLMERTTPQFNDMTGSSATAELIKTLISTNSSNINGYIDKSQNLISTLKEIKKSADEEETKRHEAEEETKRKTEETNQEKEKTKQAELALELAKLKANKSKES